MTDITIVLPIQNEADISQFQIDNVELGLTTRRTDGLSATEVGTSIVLSIAGSIAYDALKVTVAALLQRITVYYGDNPVRQKIGMNGISYDLREPGALDALEVDLDEIIKSEDFNAAKGD